MFFDKKSILVSMDFAKKDDFFFFAFLFLTKTDQLLANFFE